MVLHYWLWHLQNTKFSSVLQGETSEPKSGRGSRLPRLFGGKGKRGKQRAIDPMTHMGESQILDWSSGSDFIPVDS